MDYPTQVSSAQPVQRFQNSTLFDPREYLDPKRLTIMMWDQGFLARHTPGESFHDYDRILDESIVRGYNTIRIDPLPNLINLNKPDEIWSWDHPKRPFLPWANNREFSGPVGKWLIEFIAKVLEKKLFYTLSTWWFDENNWCGKPNISPKVKRIPKNHVEAAEIWLTFLSDWKKTIGFNNLVYVDIHNEVPFFMSGYKQMLKSKFNLDWDSGLPFNSEQIDFLSSDLNQAMKILQREFPELRFTASIHGDERWLSVPLNFDCLDVHFYLDADQRWLNRTKFNEYVNDEFYVTDRWFSEFSDRCTKSRNSVMPMLFQKQQQKLANFSAWAESFGMPLTTSESWASWFYFDHPDLNWDWLLEWSKMTVEGAIRHKMWGWTPHNYVQPQFKNWSDVEWHQKLTERFLNS